MAKILFIAMADKSVTESESPIAAAVLTATAQNATAVRVALETTSADEKQPARKPLAANATSGVDPIPSKGDKSQSLNWRNQRGKLTEIQPGLLLSDFFAARSCHHCQVVA